MGLSWFVCVSVCVCVCVFKSKGQPHHRNDGEWQFWRTSHRPCLKTMGLIILATKVSLSLSFFFSICPSLCLYFHPTPHISRDNGIIYSHALRGMNALWRLPFRLNSHSPLTNNSVFFLKRNEKKPSRVICPFLFTFLLLCCFFQFFFLKMQNWFWLNTCTLLFEFAIF